jgi:hypothetical protein
MMMNIRGLVVDDPVHTTHLQTLQFAAPPNVSEAVSETETGTGTGTRIGTETETEEVV